MTVSKWTLKAIGARLLILAFGIGCLVAPVTVSYAQEGGGEGGGEAGGEGGGGEAGAEGGEGAEGEGAEGGGPGSPPGGAAAAGGEAEGVFETGDTTEPKEPTGPKPTVDPFRALIVPKKPPAPPVVRAPTVKPVSGPPPPPPPVSFNVVAIAGEEPDYVAVVEYKKDTYIVQPGAKVPADDQVDFEVKSVSSDKVEVYDPKAKRIVRRNLPAADKLPGGDTVGGGGGDAGAGAGGEGGGGF